MSAQDQFLGEGSGSEPQGQTEPEPQPGQQIIQPIAQSALTPQILLQLFPEMTAETAVALIAGLPQLCGQVSTAIQNNSVDQEQYQLSPMLAQAYEEELLESRAEIEKFITELEIEPTKISENAPVALKETEAVGKITEGSLPEPAPAPVPTPTQEPKPEPEAEPTPAPIPAPVTPPAVAPITPPTAPPTTVPTGAPEEEEINELIKLLIEKTKNSTQVQTGQRTGTGGARFPWLASTDEAGKTVMMDSFEMDIEDSSIVVKDGKLTADAVMTAAMVQDYSGKKVLKDPIHLAKSCDAWPIGMPCTNRHPPEGIVMSQDEVVGFTSAPMWDETTQTVRCSITITDGKTIAAIQDGKTDVSIGFFCDLVETPGTFNDMDYDAVQENIVYNHLAVALDKGHGRCPNGTCGVQGDSSIALPGKEEECPCCDHYYEMCDFISVDAQLTAAQRKELPDDVFCGPDRAFPVPDCAHYTAALRMLSRYTGSGDKADIKACIEKRGIDMSCPTAKDQESLHMQMLKEQTTALVEMSKKISENITTMSKEEMSTLMDGMREMMWKLNDNLRIAKALEIVVPAGDMVEAVRAIGDAAILQHQITSKPKSEAERAMAHFELTAAAWAALTAEEQQALIAKLPKRGTGLEDKEMKAGKFELVAGYPDTHNHFADLDGEGNGTSTKNDDHDHNIKAFSVELSNEHSHTLQAIAAEEETSMSDEDKKTKEAADAAAKDTEEKKDAVPPKEPTDKAPKDQADPAEKPPEKDEASLYIDKLMKDEHTKLVDAIMATEPSRERPHYEDKSLDELKELSEFISDQNTGDVTIPAGASAANDSTRKAKNDAYETLEEKLRTK